MEKSVMDPLVQELLSPISAEKPCGEDLSFSPEFDRIHEARREDDPTLDYGEWESALKQADWKTVVHECQALLKEKAKDMRVAAWLTEGLIKTEGFVGLRRGLEINAGLLRQFGTDIHPRSDDGDDERRVGITSWFIQRAAYLIRCISLTDSAAGKFSLMDYDAAVSLQLQLQRHPDSVPDIEERVSLAKFAHAASATDPMHFSLQLDIVAQCEQLVQALSSHLDDVLGKAAPSIKPLVESVDEVRTRLRGLCKDMGLSIVNEEAEEDFKEIRAAASSLQNKALVNRRDAHAASTTVEGRLSGGRIETRTDAIEALRQVAAYFRDAEPHSPVAYLAEKALHWSTMPLHLWLRTVVKDPGVLSHLEEMLGAADSGNVPGA